MSAIGAKEDKGKRLPNDGNEVCEHCDQNKSTKVHISLGTVLLKFMHT